MNFKGNLAVFEESARVVSKGNGKNKLSAAEEIILGILHNGKCQLSGGARKYRRGAPRQFASLCQETWKKGNVGKPQ
jgi:hypothetical protein